MLSDLLYQDRVFVQKTGKYEITFCGISNCVFNREMNRNGKHCHDCFEICFVTKGNGIFLNGGLALPVEKDAVFIGSPFVEHEIILGSSDTLEISYLSFNLSKLRPDGKNTAADEIIDTFLAAKESVGSGQPHIGEYIGMIKNYIALGGEYATESLIFTMILDMLKSLSGGFRYPMDETAEIKRRIDGYVYQNSDRKITIRDLCRASGLSERSLYYFFKKNYGITPNNYILNVKISAAVGYLKMGIPEKNVALQFGFSDPASFCRCFKRLRGISPGQFSFSRK